MQSESQNQTPVKITANPKTQTQSPNPNLPVTWLGQPPKRPIPVISEVPSLMQRILPDPNYPAIEPTPLNPTQTPSQIAPTNPTSLTSRNQTKHYIPRETLKSPRSPKEFTIHCHTCLTPVIVSSLYPLTQDPKPQLTCPIDPAHKVEVLKTDGYDHMAMALNLPRPLAISMLKSDQAIYHNSLAKLPSKRQLTNHNPHNRPPHVTYPKSFTNAEWADKSMQSLSQFSHGASAQSLACNSCGETFTFFINLDNPRLAHKPLTYCPRCASPSLTSQLNTDDSAWVFLATKYNIPVEYIKALYQMFEQQNQYSHFNDYLTHFKESMLADLSQYQTSNPSTQE